MKHFLLNCRTLRNVCAVLFCLTAVVVLLWGVSSVLLQLVTPGRSSIEMYETLKHALYLNALGGVVLGIGLVIYSGEPDKKVTMLATAGLSGVVSFLGYGFFILVYGFSAGKILASLGYGIIIGYACVALLIGTRMINCHIWDKMKKNTQGKEVVDKFSNRIEAAM